MIMKDHSKQSRSVVTGRRRFVTPLALFTALTVTALSGATVASASAQGLQERVANATELARMQQFTDNRVDPSSVVDHFVAPDGSEVDCVDINRQPALTRPEMRGHRIELQPRTWPDGPEASHLNADEQEAEQETKNFGLGCPEGSVPITRISLDTLRRFRTLEDFFKKVPSHLQSQVSKRASEATGDFAMNSDGEEPPRDGPTSLHQYAYGNQAVVNWGGESVLNLWSPYVQRSNEFSLSQIWVVRGSGSTKETVEAGWQLYPDKYGDWNARLFIYFTPDNYGSGGCYNNDCGKFVQVSNTIYPGTKYSAYSTYDGPQKTITLLLYKDGTTGSWWLRHGDTWVGYWPRSLFDSAGLRDQAARVTFGGEIIDRQTGGTHTRTDMGSGQFPAAGFGRAAYQRGIRYVDTSRFYRNVSLAVARTDSYCYDIAQRTSSSSGWERYFYFGGSGYNTNCQ
jgi:hypothetical protein